MVALLALGFGLRLWIATTTDNADARTLAWGSSFVATGSATPYRDIVANSDGDPIPLGGIRSLSLAQGYLGVAVGAVPMAIGDQLGLIHLGDRPDGHAFHQGELFAYKLSYLVPELIILWSIGALLGPRRKRLLGYAAWATTPLMYFTWGQGMPDTWTIAAIMAALALLTRAETAVSRRAITRSYAAAAAVIAVGAWGTKLLPIVLLLPFVVVVSRDRRLTVRARTRVLLIAAALQAGLAMPYVVDPFLRANVLVRFEFDMLFSGPGVSTASGLWAAQFGLMALVALTVWMVAGPNPAARVRPWTIGSVLLITTTGGIITHLLVWALVAILLVIATDERIAVGLHAAMGLGVAWHLLSYDWLAGIFVYSISRRLTVGGTQWWLTSHVPGFNVLAATISSAMVVSVVALAARHWSPRLRISRERVAPLRLMVSVGGVTFAGATVALVAAGVIASRDGVARWDLGYGAFPKEEPLYLAGGDSYRSEVIDSAEPVNVVTFRVARDTQPSLDDLRIRLVRGGRTLASVREPIWQAEPLSDRGVIRASFDRTVQPLGARLVVDRVVSSGRSGMGSSSSDAILALESVATADGLVRPAMTLRHATPDAFDHRLLAHLFSPVRVLLVPLLACLVALFAAWLLRRGSSPWEPDDRVDELDAEFADLVLTIHKEYR